MYLGGIILGFILYFLLRYCLGGFYTVSPNEKAVLTSFGKAKRLQNLTTLDLPISSLLDEEEKDRFVYPQLEVVGPGLHFKWPWQKVHKVSIAIETFNMAFDPETPSANKGGIILEAVTKDQLNTGLTGQIRFKVCEQNLYAFIFGVKDPITHVMGYFVSVLRQLISNFEAPKNLALNSGNSTSLAEAAGISINDLRKNLSLINDRMFQECQCTAARYGIILDASLITGIEPPIEVESALAAINTAHNHVSSEISLAQAAADQKIVASHRAVEIETLKAQAEVQPLLSLAEQLQDLKSNNALETYLRNVKLSLFAKASKIIREEK
jgi:regulator of protease activity HflC (stomatin/prohibitin superfamily)